MNLREFIEALVDGYCWIVAKKAEGWTTEDFARAVKSQLSQPAPAHAPAPKPADKRRIAVTTVGGLRKLLRGCDDGESISFNVEVGGKIAEGLYCTGVGSTAGGRATILWLNRARDVDASQPPLDYDDNEPEET